MKRKVLAIVLTAVFTLSLGLVLASPAGADVDTTTPGSIEIYSGT